MGRLAAFHFASWRDRTPGHSRACTVTSPAIPAPGTTAHSRLMRSPSRRCGVTVHHNKGIGHPRAKKGMDCCGPRPARGRTGPFTALHTRTGSDRPRPDRTGPDRPRADGPRLPSLSPLRPNGSARPTWARDRPARAHGPSSEFGQSTESRGREPGRNRSSPLHTGLTPARASHCTPITPACTLTQRCSLTGPLARLPARLGADSLDAPPSASFNLAHALRLKHYRPSEAPESGYKGAGDHPTIR